MSKEKITHLLLWKTCENGLFAHVYEHLAVDAINDYMTSYGQYLMTDYDLFGNTYGTTCFMDATSYTAVARQLFAKALESFRNAAITNEVVDKAAQECGIECSREVLRIDARLTNQISKIHQSSWRDIAAFASEQASEATSVNTFFSSNELSFTEISGAFTEIILEYAVNEKLTGNLAHKALAVMVIQALALNFSRHLAQKYVYYDAGDEWAEGAAEVGYRTTLRMPISSDLQAAALQMEFEKFKAGNIDAITCALERLLKSNYAQDYSTVYYGQKYLNQILGGGVVGGKGWESIASIEAITPIVEAVRLKIY